MNTLRNKLTSNFTIVPNEIVSDNRLTMKAKAIFLYLLSKPDDWDFYIQHIADSCTDGKNAIQTGLKELEEHGYLMRKKKVNEINRFDGWEYIMKLPDNTISRQRDFPIVENYDSRNTTSYNKTDSTKTNLTKTDSDIYIHHFDEFWDLYDKKVERKKCERKWKKLSKDDIESILQFVPIYKESVSSKQYQKNPFTFLNSRIWEDDWENYKPKANEAHQQFSERQPSRTSTFAQRGQQLLDALREREEHPERYNSWQIEGRRTDPYSTR